MPFKKKPIKKNLLVLIVDVGKNQTQFEKVKACTFHIYKGKLFKEKSGDDVGLIVLGSEESENSQNLAHICVAVRPCIPSWSNLKAISNLERSNRSTDWLKGLQVALDLVKQSSIGQSYDKTAFILISNFESSVDKNRLDEVSKSIVKQNIEVFLIGSPGETLAKVYPTSYECVRHLSSCSNVNLSTLDKCIQETFLIPKEEKNPAEWNVALSIGDTTLPITGYKWIGSDYANIWIRTKDNETVTRSQTYQKENDPDQTPLEASELVRGYRYGDTVIPMTMVEEKAMKYESGERGLQLICFTRRSNVPVYMLDETTVYLITASEKSTDNSQFVALVEELISLDYVAIVRQVYNKNAAVTVQAMYPFMEDADEDENCKSKRRKYYFAMVQLPFAQQINNMHVREVVEFSKYFDRSKDSFTSEEENGVHRYLESLDLAKGVQYVEDIPYLPEATRDPYTQRLAYAQIQKQLNPKLDFTSSAPETEIPEQIRSLYEPMAKVHEAADELKQHVGQILSEIKNEEDNSENDAKNNVKKEVV